MESQTTYIDWAEKALGGAFFYDDERTVLARTAPDQLLEDELGHRRLCYTVALRGLAALRAEERASSDGAFDPKAWEPLPYQLEALRPEFEPITRQLALLNNLERHVARYKVDPQSTGLRIAQKDSFENIVDFVRKATVEQLNFEDGVEAVTTKAGYLDLPTAYGKMFMEVELCKAFGIGKPAAETSPRRLRSLLLVPRKVLVKQMLEEFALHAPGIRATEYTGRTKDPEGDAVIMTYQMFHRMMEAGLMSQFGIDLLLPDEAHNALGEAIRGYVNEFRRGILAIGCTASSDYGEDHNVRELLLPNLIHHVDVRTAIEAGGILSGVQCVSYATGAELVVSNFGADDFTQAELAKLAENEARNIQAQHFAKAFVESGIQGIVSCIAGGDNEYPTCAHAIRMADELKDMDIIDPKTGERRKMRAEAVGGFLSDSRMEEILEDYDNGKIDVLTFVKIIAEGWDSDKAKFLLSLSPTTSPVRAIQRFGRVLRPGAVACVVEFIDRVVGGRKKFQYTFMHILGEEHFRQSHVYEGARDSASPEVLDVKRLPPEMRERIAQLEAIPIDELIVMARALEAPPNDWVSMSTLAEIANGMNAQYIRKLLLSAGFEGRIARGRINTPTYYFAPEAVDYLKQNILLDRPGKGWINLSQISTLLDITDSMTNRLIRDLEITGTMARATRTKAARYYSPDDFARIEAEVAKIEVAAPGEATWDSMAAEWDISKTLIFRKCKELEIDGVLKRVRLRGPMAYYFTRQEKRTLRQALNVKPRAPEGWSSILAMAKAARVGRTVVEKYLRDQDLLSGSRTYRSTTGDRVGGPAPHWRPDVVAQVLTAVARKDAPPGWHPLYDYGLRHNIPRPDLKKAVAALNLRTRDFHARRRSLAHVADADIERLNTYFGISESSLPLDG